MGCEFAGYADDLALLVPSPSALRIMLHICEDFAKLHGLRFNANKTGFCKGSSSENFMFCGTRLEFSQEVIHLGHTLLENLDDSLDISKIFYIEHIIFYVPSHLLTILFSQC